MFARFFGRKSKTQKKSITRSPRRRRVPLSFEWLESRVVPSATVVDFEDLSLAPNSFRNGSNGSGGFVSRGSSFNNSYDPTFGDWSGWSYTNVNYTNAALYPNYPNDPDYTYQYGAYIGTGVGGAGNYGVAFCSDPAFGGVLPTVTIPTGMQVQSAYFTNTTDAALSMLNGDAFAKKFGPSDWFDLTITGEDASKHVVGTVDFYLAQNGSIVTTWQSVNLSSLAAAKTLVFSETSSDTGAFGMNTPAYFAMDYLTLVPKTTTIVSASSAAVVYGNPITFTATVTAAGGSAAPTAGSVDFMDTTTGKDLGNGTFVVGAGTSSTATITVAANNANLFNISAGDNIVATYTPGIGFTGSTGATTVAITGKYAINLVGGNTVTAGSTFLFTVQASDALGNPLPTYNGPTSVTINSSSPDPQSNFPLNGALQFPSSGFGFFVGSLNTAGTYTLTATTGGTLSGTSATITVMPAAANHFTVTAPASATTGTPFNVTVKAFDAFGNVATGFTGTVNILTTDPAATAVAPYTFVAADNGVHTFSVTLNSNTLTTSNLGTTIIASGKNAGNVPIAGLSNPVTVQGLVVTGFQPTATGFTVTFSKPLTPTDLTMFGPTGTVPDVTLTGAGVANISGNLNVPGTLFLDPTIPNTIVFKATSAFLDYLNSAADNGTDTESVALPDGTYTVTLKSGTGTNGFVDALNTHLDGLATGGSANYTQTFTTTYQDDAHTNAHPTAVLSIPDFARGPDGSTAILVPNFKTTPGIPIVLYNAAGVTDATFTLTFNPQILTPTAGTTADSTAAGSTFTMGTITSVDSTHSTVSFTYHNATAKSGTVVLGDILATVPNSAAALYKTKEVLALSGITVTPTPTTPVLAADGIHVNAYLGDVHVTDGPTLNTADALDVSTKVSTAGYSGFAAYALLDPAIIANVFAGVNDGLGGLGTVVVNGSDVTALFSKAAGIAVPAIPNIPAAVTAVSVTGADPTLSLVGDVQTKGIVSVAVILDDPHPAGSTGMTEAHLALTYDPSILRVLASDITLGSIPGAGWRITSEVDVATGQIGINIFNPEGAPITATQAGSLVNIAFHVVPGARLSGTAVQLVSQATPNGHRLVTEVDDDQGPLTLTPGMDRICVFNKSNNSSRIKSTELTPNASRGKE